MRWLAIAVLVFVETSSASAQTSVLDRLKNWLPTVTLPSMPDLGIPELSQTVVTGFKDFTQQIIDSLPLLEELGYEVGVFRVQWAIPPKSKLRLRSTTTIDPDKIDAVVGKAAGAGAFTRALIASAAEAKRLQSRMKLGTALIDVDFALPPKIRMSFVGGRTEVKSPTERELLDLDTVCAMALN